MEGEENERNNPNQRPTGSRQPGEATRSLFPPADSNTTQGGEAGGGSRSKAGKKGGGTVPSPSPAENEEMHPKTQSAIRQEEA